MNKTAFINARLIDPATNLDTPGRIIVEDEFIAAVDPGKNADGLGEGIEVIDCGGHVLSPGLIDMRVFIGEPGEDDLESYQSAGESAVAGGVTSLVAMPNTHPPLDEPAILGYAALRARLTSPAKIYLAAAASQGLEGEKMSEIGLLSEAGAILFTDGDKPIANPALMRRALSYASRFGAVVANHAEVTELSHGGHMAEGEYAMRIGIAGIPEEAESIMVARDLELAALTGGRYHLGQISARRSLEAFARARAEGVKATCAVSAHHLLLNDLDVGDYDTRAKLNPPLRSEETRGLLVEAAVKGEIDALVSSHHPRRPEEKLLPFADAAAGAIGLETLLPAALQLHHEYGADLLTVFRMLTSGPADILGLAQGRLTIGAPADLALIDVGYPMRIDPDTFKSRTRNTPLKGRTLQGRALRTVVAGVSHLNEEAS